MKDRSRPTLVRTMFARISSHYDTLNRIMTFGRDKSWRHFLVNIACIPKGGHVLDVGTGTGDIAFEVLRNNKTNRVVGVDFTLEMIDMGHRRPGGRKIAWCRADALQLPFPDNTFDVVTSGFLLRNVTDIGAALKEQIRVVKPGGRVVCLETSPNPYRLIRPFVLFHMKNIIPFLGHLIAGQKKAYQYLPASTLEFMKPEELAALMAEVGLCNVSYKRFMFGTIAAHWGERPI
ncbi:MAG: ubiquinone/menaquinone biosynthesis methyltransferase [Deltaproteobacteria bacterium]|nr:ubiquinone/menaquinone biosynthesis methyltransferase [Deltaproteobacteria bacterium]